MLLQSSFQSFSVGLKIFKLINAWGLPIQVGVPVHTPIVGLWSLLYSELLTVVPRIEPGALCVLSDCPTTELQSQPKKDLLPFLKADWSPAL